MRFVRRSIPGALLAALLTTVTACAPVAPTGDDVAASQARADAEAFAETLGHLDRVRPIEYFVAEFFAPDGSGPGGATTEAVAWSGRVEDTEVATIDVRFIRSVEASSAPSIGGASHGAGRAELCFRYSLQLYRYTEYTSIPCTDDPAPMLPAAPAIARLPDDAEERIVRVLAAGEDAQLQEAIRTAFPEEFVSVDTAEADGELVVAAGVPAERDCVVVVRHADGEIERISFDRVWLEPGELGCSVALYLSPPL